MAQTEDDLECIARQERELQWTSFNEDDAWQLGSTLRELAVERQPGRRAALLRGTARHLARQRRMGPP
jgi:uncharacterized protein (UPF0303 family)